MSEFLSLILNQLTVPPGDGMYSAVLVFSAALAMYSAFDAWKASEYPQAQRAVVGLGVLLAVQVLMLLVKGLAWQNLVNARMILPPLERGMMVFCLVWIAWLYAFPEPNRAGDFAAGILSGLVVAGTGLSYVSWQFQIADPQSATLPYNQTSQDWIWQISAASMGLFGMIIIALRKPAGRWNGMTVLALGMAGHLTHLAFPGSGDFPGAVRLAYVAAFPILLTLPQRFLIPPAAPDPSRETSIENPERAKGEPRRYGTDPRTFHALLALAVESTPDKVTQAIPCAISRTMLSDLCFMVHLTENTNQIFIASGYDLKREDSLEGVSLDKRTMPGLANALQRGRPLRMPGSSTSADHKGLGEVLGVSNLGHVLFVPIRTPEKENLGGILLLSAHSGRVWTGEDQSFLSNIAASLVPVIKRSQNLPQLEAQAEQARNHTLELENQVQELHTRLEAAHVEMQKQSEMDAQALQAVRDESQKVHDQLQLENSALASENSSLRESQDSLKATHALELNSLKESDEAAQKNISALQTELSFLKMVQLEPPERESTPADSIDKTALENSLQRIEELKAEIAQLRALEAGVSSAPPSSPLENELKASREEAARLKNQLAENNQKMHEMKNSLVEPNHSEQAKVAASISKELRQPLITIVEYTDRLLGESAGLLGASQRKLIEQIKASTERLRSLTDGMIQINTLEEELRDLQPETVDLNSIIDYAMSYTSAQVREKNISIHLELPKTLTAIQADREAFQHILIHLLQNAGAATPYEGSIRLKVKTQSEDEQEYTLVQVTDSGGGIAASDLPGVFTTRLYRTNDALIQGVGDTGVGLSIAKALTEAHHGRIWVESIPGQGSTFSVLLPMAGAADAKTEGDAQGI